MTAIGPTMRPGIFTPLWAVIALLVAFFLRAPTTYTFPIWVATVGALVAGAVWRDANPERLRGLGAIEWSMIAYVLWNFFSAVIPHHYPPDVSPVHFILIPTAIPFLLYVFGRFTLDSRNAVKAVMWSLIGFASYSAAVSIMQFHGPMQWVWPRFIIDAPNWEGRAVGVFNQPVANGMVMALGIAIVAMLIRWGVTWWQRIVLFAVAVACGYGLFLTHTRAAWLSGVVVLIIGTMLAVGYRRGFVVALALVVAVVAVNWSKFTSSDRSSGGVASAHEVEDRLNTIQTSLWAIGEKPFVGWGLARFSAVNTFHHKQWSLEVPWMRGYGIVSHENELGILAELGVVGLATWLTVLVLISKRLWDAYRRLPSDDRDGKSLAVLAIMTMAILVFNGITVDLRFFDFPMAATFLIFGLAAGWADRSTGRQLQSPFPARFEESARR